MIVVIIYLVVLLGVGFLPREGLMIEDLLAQLMLSWQSVGPAQVRRIVKIMGDLASPKDEVGDGEDGWPFRVVQLSDHVVPEIGVSSYLLEVILLGDEEGGWCPLSHSNLGCHFLPKGKGFALHALLEQFIQIFGEVLGVRVQLVVHQRLELSKGENKGKFRPIVPIVGHNVCRCLSHPAPA